MSAGQKLPRIVMIGAGNVASSLAPAIEKAGAGKIVQVYSRTPGHARDLAARLENAVAISRPEDIDTGADICLVSVADDAVAKIVAAVKPGNALWLHTSGSVPMSVLAPASPRHGVFYPLQTFSRDVAVDLSTVSLFTEGADEETEAEIRELASKVFSNVFHADSVTRRVMHVAAVFACNFVNYMWVVAHDLLQRENLPMDVLFPLLTETLRKAMTASPDSGQTGPAVRGDLAVMSRHLDMLDGDNREIYRLVSEAIMNRFNVSHEPDKL